MEPTLAELLKLERLVQVQQRRHTLQLHLPVAQLVLGSSVEQRVLAAVVMVQRRHLHILRQVLLPQPGVVGQ